MHRLRFRNRRGGTPCRPWRSAFRVPVLITHEVRETIDSMSAFAPLHIRAELEGMRIIESLRGAVTQVAIFDTGFHSEMALWAQSTLVRMSGSKAAFAATGSTASIISTVPSVPHRCSERVRKSRQFTKAAASISQWSSPPRVSDDVIILAGLRPHTKRESGNGV